MAQEQESGSCISLSALALELTQHDFASNTSPPGFQEGRTLQFPDEMPSVQGDVDFR